MEEVIVTSDVTEGFVFSGFKQVFCKLLPLQTQIFRYRLWPLLSGSTKLPHFHVSVKRESAPTAAGDSSSATSDFKEVEDTAQPIGIFVHPKKRQHDNH
jgi:hypothetical protein